MADHRHRDAGPDSGARAAHGAGSDPPAETTGDAGLSLDSISRAFAAMLEGGDDPYSHLPSAESDPLIDQANEAIEHDALAEQSPSHATCHISPQSILESILFVGTPDNRPISSGEVAAMMRGVRPAEIDDLVADLNRRYRQEGRPYSILAQGDGYRMALRDEFSFLRDVLHGRTRTARLSPAAVEVLAVVAYNEPVTADQIAQMRGTASGPILAQLVRRELLRIDRPAERRHAARYFTTPRFLRLFGLSGLNDLPRSREIE